MYDTSHLQSSAFIIRDAIDNLVSDKSSDRVKSTHSAHLHYRNFLRIRDHVWHCRRSISTNLDLYDRAALQLKTKFNQHLNYFLNTHNIFHKRVLSGQIYIICSKLTSVLHPKDLACIRIMLWMSIIMCSNQYNTYELKKFTIPTMSIWSTIFQSFLMLSMDHNKGISVDVKYKFIHNGKKFYMTCLLDKITKTQLKTYQYDQSIIIHNDRLEDLLIEYTCSLRYLTLNTSSFIYILVWIYHCHFEKKYKHYKNDLILIEQYYTIKCMIDTEFANPIAHDKSCNTCPCVHMFSMINNYPAFYQTLLNFVKRKMNLFVEMNFNDQ